MIGWIDRIQMDRLIGRINMARGSSTLPVLEVGDFDPGPKPQEIYVS